MAEDISNKTIVVLVILTVIISILGTVVVLSEVSNVKTESGAVAESGSNGKVSLEILPEKEPAMAASTGHVSLNIMPADE